MAILKNWAPLNMPRGSIRGIVSLALLAVLWLRMLSGGEHEVPMVFVALALLVLGHYFGSLGEKSPEDKAPLGLPVGTVRALVVLGFGVVGYILWRDGRLEFGLENRNFTILLVVAGLVVGVLVRALANLVLRDESSRLRRWYENIKSLTVIVTTLLLAILTMVGPADDGTDNLTLVLIPIVSFYFGSR